MARRRRRAIAAGLALAALAALGLGLAARDRFAERRVAVVEPGALIRGAWQSPEPLRRVVEREKIRTVVTLTAINRDDPKYVEQERALQGTGVDWVIVPMRGSRATLDQMAEAADLLADPARRPAFFHCVGGHHRTSLAHAAFLIRHRAYTAEAAWAAIERLPWTRPDADADRSDRRLIEAFARRERDRLASRTP